MSRAYGALRCMRINFETTWLCCCVSLPNVPKSLSVILTQALTGVSRGKYLSFSPTTFGQLETPHFYACLRNKFIIKTPTKYGLATLPVVLYSMNPFAVPF
jgi:hypothetical protein